MDFIASAAAADVSQPVSVKVYFPAPRPQTGKGAICDAARKAGVPKTTALDHLKKAKGGLSDGTKKSVRKSPSPSSSPRNETIMKKCRGMRWYWQGEYVTAASRSPVRWPNQAIVW